MALCSRVAAATVRNCGSSATYCPPTLARTDLEIAAAARQRTPISTVVFGLLTHHRRGWSHGHAIGLTQTNIILLLRRKLSLNVRQGVRSSADHNLTGPTRMVEGAPAATDNTATNEELAPRSALSISQPEAKSGLGSIRRRIQKDHRSVRLRR